jgi:hypothetical protein
MNDFLVCSNPDCRMVLDRRMNGESFDGVAKIVKKCPECGSAWSKKLNHSARQKLVQRRATGLSL